MGFTSFPGNLAVIDGFHKLPRKSSCYRWDFTSFPGNPAVIGGISQAFRIWQYVKGGIPENEADWLVAGYSTSAHFDMTGLDDFTKYYFRYAAITTQGTTDFCEPVAKVIG